MPRRKLVAFCFIQTFSDDETVGNILNQCSRQCLQGRGGWTSNGGGKLKHRKLHERGNASCLQATPLG